MNIVILDTYYPRFLSDFFLRNEGLDNECYETQMRELLGACFGTSDFYSRHLNALGHNAIDLIVNCEQLQLAWARENNFVKARIELYINPILKKVPIIGAWLSCLQSLTRIAIEQIKLSTPDVLYCQDMWFLPPLALKKLRPYVGMFVGQIASPTPPEYYLKEYDLILTSFPHFVEMFRGIGIPSEYFPIGFDPRVLSVIGPNERDIDVSFVGGFSRNHKSSLETLEYLAEHTQIQLYGYGVKNLRASSPIRRKHSGEAWGIDMYKILGRSKIAFNRHIDIAGSYANNMRLFEATGSGALLITDQKENLSELFNVGNEIITYSSKEEAADLIDYFTKNPQIAESIAKNGQLRTLNDHTYEARMIKLIELINSHMR